MSSSDKLNFIITKTKEYLTAAGLTNQLYALTRLENENADENSTVHVGQISLTDLNPNGTSDGYTLGMYKYLIDTATNDWLGDADGTYNFKDGQAYFDGGLLIDENLINDKSTNWYEIVDVMVHELTHATAYINPTSYTKWGEYVAYQTDEDYLDSVGEDQYTGPNEKSGITDHIKSFSCYDGETVPTFKWWTYG
jgi:hypothetical protein